MHTVKILRVYGNNSILFFLFCETIAIVLSHIFALVDNNNIMQNAVYCSLNLSLSYIHELLLRAQSDQCSQWTTGRPHC